MYGKEAKINVSLSWERCKFLGFLVDFRWEHLLGLILVLCRLSLFRKEFLFPFLSHTYALLIRASRGTHRSVWLRKKKDGLSLIISLGFNRKEIHFSEHWNQTIASLQLFQGSDVNSAKHIFISFEIYWKSRVLDKQRLTKTKTD